MSRPQAISNCSLEFKEKPCVSLKFEVGSNTFELWCTLRHSFACHSNEGFLAKLLEIAQEYLLSKQMRHLSGSSSSDGDSGNSSSTLLPEGSSTAAEQPVMAKSTEPKPRARKLRPRAEQLDVKAGAETCRYCDGSHSHSECLVHKPEALVYDSGHLDGWEGYCKSLEDTPLAKLSLPSCLALASEGVVTKVAIKAFTQFGPLVGPKVKEVDIRDDCNMRHIWELQLESGNVYIDTEDSVSSNWLRYVRAAPTRPERNLSAIIREEGLYLVSIRALRAGEELLYWQDTFGDSRKRNDKTVCGGCNMTFGHPLHYKVHCSLFHDMRYSLTIRKYHCKVCGAAILGKENIRKHATEQHNGKGAYQCQFCNKFFLRLSYLEMHRTYGCSSNPQRSKSLCDFCGRNFCQPQKLKIHIKRMHSSLPDVLKDFQCKQCLKILGSRAALQRHTKEVHDKQVDATYGCTICAKHFQNKSNLKIHMLTHSGIKPFKCIVDECSAAFTTKQCLQLHYRKVHSFDSESMPKIERAVSYTFQAYSGAPKGQVKQPSFEDASSGDMFDSSIGLDRPPSAQLTAAQTLHTVEEIISKPSAVKLMSKGEKKWVASDSAKTLMEGFEPSAEFGRRESSNASLLVEAALDSVCNDASLDIDVEVSHNCPETFGANIYDYQLQESQDINLISPSVHDHISVTDEIKDPDNMDIQYGQLPEAHFRPESRNSGTSLAKEGLHDATEPYGGQSPRRYDFVGSMNPDHLSSDESGPDDPSKSGGYPDRPALRVKSSIRMHDYFRRLWFEENVGDNTRFAGDAEDMADKPKYEQEMAADLRSRFEADLESRVRHYEPNLDPERQHSKGGELLNLIDADFRPERPFEPVALNSSDLQGLDMSTRSFHNYSSNINRYHPAVYPDLDLRLNYTPPPYDLVRVVSLDLTPPGRHSVDLSLRGLPLHQITNSRLLTEHSLTNKHRIFDLTSRIGDTSQPGGDQLGDGESRLLEHCHLLPGAAVGGASLAFGGYSGVAQPGYHAAPLDPRAHVASPANSGYHHPPYSTYYP